MNDTIKHSNNIFIETLVSKIQSDLFNEKALPFPKFPLKDQWSAIVWHEWYKTIEESQESEEGCDIISPTHFKLLVDTIFERCGSKHCWLMDTEPFVDNNGQFLERNFTKLPLNWSAFNSHYKLFEYTPSRFYMADESLTWFVHVDESVLIAGDQQFMTLFVEKIGGYETVLKNLNNYAGKGANQQTKQWVSNIIQRFESKHKNANT